MGLIANQIKYGQTKVVNFTIDQGNHGYKKVKEIYSTPNEGKPFTAEKFIRTLKIRFVNT